MKLEVWPLFVATGKERAVHLLSTELVINFRENLRANLSPHHDAPSKLKRECSPGPRTLLIPKQWLCVLTMPTSFFERGLAVNTIVTSTCEPRKSAYWRWKYPKRLILERPEALVSDLSFSDSLLPSECSSEAFISCPSSILPNRLFTSGNFTHPKNYRTFAGKRLTSFPSCWLNAGESSYVGNELLPQEQTSQGACAQQPSFGGQNPPVRERPIQTLPHLRRPHMLWILNQSSVVSK
uniref:Uncharacterized protein n=1 Tax=Rhodosorus marinus TaxID=101924 RepID=A0A7S2Z8U9_9RHOD|mmetsp:Transcript_10357/g.43143  ORF Transcript_10357/g.43143 Transcript_10357/m.43143 type:complete len:238 (+) Transcript_10357:782-1495(+)